MTDKDARRGAGTCRGTRRGASLSLVLRCLLVAAFIGAAAGCKEKPPKLSATECETFCKRLVPCFDQLMQNFSMNVKEDTDACIKDCTGKEGESHGQILRAMKRCGRLTDCKRLQSCFRESL